MRRVLSAAVIALFCISGSAAIAQDTVKDEGKKTGEAAADAGKAAGKAGKHAGKTAAKGAKNTGRAIKNAVTGEVSATCNDGKKHSGETAAAACADHGGVKP